MNRLEKRLERLEQATARLEEGPGWQRAIINEGDPLPPGLDPNKNTIIRVIVDPKWPEKMAA
jgi:hypothetical protein